MAHCYSVGVEIDGKEEEICTTHVPGNEALKRDIEVAEKGTGTGRAPTKEEVDRAVEFWKSERPKDRHRPNARGHPWQPYP